MFRGTTPTHTFILPIEASLLTDAYITYAQHGSTKIEKRLSDCVRDDNKLVVVLSQLETLSLMANNLTEIQVAAKVGGKVMRSQIISVPTERILKDGEI